MLGETSLPHSKKLISTLAIALILTASATGILVDQNVVLSKANDDLLRTNARLSNTLEGDELILELKNVTAELKAVKKNYTDLLEFFGTSDPKIVTRLGATLIDPVNNPDDNYVWVTGEVENSESRTVYDARLKFTLFTNNGVETIKDLIGTMQPHQIVARRFAVHSSVGKITNWSIEAVATFTPTNYSTANPLEEQSK